MGSVAAGCKTASLKYFMITDHKIELGTVTCNKPVIHVYCNKLSYQYDSFFMLVLVFVFDVFI